MALVGIQDYIAGTAFQSPSASVAAAVAGARSIQQVVSAVNRDVFTTTSTAFVPLTGFSVTITPISLTSCILLFGMVNFQTSTLGAGFNILCNGQEIYPNNPVAGRYSGWSGTVPAGATNSIHFHFSFLHTPTVIGSQTYTMQVKCNNAGTLFVNRNGDDTANALTSYRAATSFTAMEITT